MKLKKLLKEKAMNIATAIRILLSQHGARFYCQSDVEGDGMCKDQCEHCKSYYAPLENNDAIGIKDNMGVKKNGLRA